MPSLSFRIFLSFIALAVLAWTLCGLYTCVGGH